MAFDFYNLGWAIEDLGFYDVVFPWLLVFLITYGILTKAKLFGAQSNKINNTLNPMIAIILAFFAIRTNWIAHLMQTFLPRVSMIMLVILMFLLILAVFSSGQLKEWAISLTVIFCVITFFYSLLAGTGILEEVGFRTGLSLDERDMAWLIPISVVGIVIWAIAGTHKKAGKIISGKEWGKD